MQTGWQKLKQSNVCGQAPEMQSVDFQFIDREIINEIQEPCFDCAGFHVAKQSGIVTYNVHMNSIWKYALSEYRMHVTSRRGIIYSFDDELLQNY